MAPRSPNHFRQKALDHFRSLAGPLDQAIGRGAVATLALQEKSVIACSVALQIMLRRGFRDGELMSCAAVTSNRPAREWVRARDFLPPPFRIEALTYYRQQGAQFHVTGYGSPNPMASSWSGHLVVIANDVLFDPLVGCVYRRLTGLDVGVMAVPLLDGWTGADRSYLTGIGLPSGWRVDWYALPLNTGYLATASCDPSRIQALSDATEALITK